MHASAFSIRTFCLLIWIGLDERSLWQYPPFLFAKAQILIADCSRSAHQSSRVGAMYRHDM
jgi:hypothetical protein